MANVLHAIKHKAISGRDLSPILGYSNQALNRLLKGMHGLGLVHIERWTDTRKHTVALACYRLGYGEDMPTPLTFKGIASTHAAADTSRLRPSSTLIAFASIVRALQQRPYSRSALTAAVGLNDSNFGKVVRHLHDLRLIHIALWMRGRSGPFVPYYSWGDRRDAPKPEPIKTSAYSRGAYARRRKAAGFEVVQRTLYGVQYASAGKAA